MFGFLLNWFRRTEKAEIVQESKPVVKFPSKRIAICVGHSRRGDNGAVSVGGVNEWTYNNQLATKMAELLRKQGHEVLVVNKYDGNAYWSAMVYVAGEVKKFNADVAVELHFNAATPTANGYEYLYWSTSPNSKKLADCFNKQHGKKLPQFRNRQNKPLTASSRGAGFVQRTHCPSIITEPFFGTNKEEWDFYAKNVAVLAAINADAIIDYFVQS
jgi:N-acetylmuramoyl-L-alanine amidase